MTNATLGFLDGPRRGERVRLGRVRMVIVRAPHGELTLAGPGVDDDHVIVEQFGGDVWIFDPGSLRGLVVNGRAVRCHHLVHGDRVTLPGHGSLLFQQEIFVTPREPSPGGTGLLQSVLSMLESSR